jgi:hypothetical protein
MDVSQLVLGYIQALAWPGVVVFFLVKYRQVLESCIPKVKLTLAGVPLEISVQQLARAVEEPFPGGTLTQEQWDWLKRLKNGRQAFKYDRDNELLRSLRNAALIRPYPNGHLATAKEVEITRIGELVLEARERQ